MFDQVNYFGIDVNFPSKESTGDVINALLGTFETFRALRNHTVLQVRLRLGAVVWPIFVESVVHLLDFYIASWDHHPRTLSLSQSPVRSIICPWS